MAHIQLFGLPDLVSGRADIDSSPTHLPLSGGAALSLKLLLIQNPFKLRFWHNVSISNLQG